MKHSVSLSYPRTYIGAANRLAVAIACMLFATQPSCALAANVIVNGSFELPALGSTTVAQIQEVNVPGWETNATDNNIEIWSMNFNNVPAADGVQHAELNATQISTLFQDVTGIPANGTVGYSFAHRGRQGVDTLELRITDLGSDDLPGGIGLAADTLMFSQQFATGNNAWVQYNSPNIGPQTLGNAMRFEFESIAAAGGNKAIGNFLDNVQFGIDVGENVPEPSAGVLVLAASLSMLAVLRLR